MKSLRRQFLVLAAVILLCVAAAYIMKINIGQSIQHFKQCLIPGKGQIAFSPQHETPIYIPFYFLDEEELSEMAEASNIKKITLQTAEGQELSADSWTVEEAPATDASHMKLLTVALPPQEHGCKLEKISLTYVDKTETFSVGDLSLTAIDAGVYLSSLWIAGNYLDLTTVNEFPTHGFYSQNINFMELYVTNYYAPITVTGVDFGVEGHAVDMSSLRQLGTTSVDYSRYQKNSTYGVYRDLDQAVTQGEVEVDEQTPPDVNQTEVNDQLLFIASICFDSSQDDIFCYYINPVFHCTEVNGTTFQWAAVGAANYVTPILSGTKGEEQAKEYLERDGV